MPPIVLLIAGLIVLVIGAELLVRGAATLARRLGLPSLVVGLTVVAFGTSAPEVAVSVKGALDGQGGLAIGNVVGSNIFNLLFILGISALITPLAVARQLIRLDVPLMIGVSLLVWGLAANGILGRMEGLILLAGIVGYTALQVVLGLREGAAAEEGGEAPPPRHLRGFVLDGVLALGGLALLVLGAQWLVEAAVALAAGFGVSDMVIGLTIVAAGTSLPEVATSVMASIRGQRDIAVGNVVGSNVFNLLAVLGAAASVAPAGLAVPEASLWQDFPAMVLVAVACLPIFFTGATISRGEGATFLGLYVAYTALLVLQATGNPVAGAFGRALLFGAVPLAALVLLVTSVRELRHSPATADGAP